VREYFVSYYFEAKRGGNGYGNMTIRRPALIACAGDIQGIADYICRQNKFKQVCVINWQRYEQPVALLGGPK
jgi:hypothetical protein